MQALPAPIGRGQQRHGDLVPHRRARLVIVVVERMREDFVAEIAAVFGQFPIGQRHVAAHQFARGATARAALAQSVLHGLHLHVVPVRPKGGQDAAVVGHVAVPIGCSFPDAHRREVRRLQRGDMPLVDAIVRNAVQPDLAARPRLHARPLDAVVEVFGLARRKMVYGSGRAAGAARIDAHAHIAVGHPLFRIDDLPALVQIGRAVRNVGMLGDHALPRARVALLEGEAFRVGTVGENDWITSIGLRAKHVGAQHQSVLHEDRQVPIDAHAIAQFAVARSHRVSLVGGCAFGPALVFGYCMPI